MTDRDKEIRNQKEYIKRVEEYKEDARLECRSITGEINRLSDKALAADKVFESYCNQLHWANKDLEKMERKCRTCNGSGVINGDTCTLCNGEGELPLITARLIYGDL